MKEVLKTGHNFSFIHIWREFKFSLLTLLGLYMINELSTIFSPYFFSRLLRYMEGFYNGELSIRSVYICNMENTLFWVVWIGFGALVKVYGGILFTKIESFIKRRVFYFLHNISYEDFLLIASEKAFNYLKSLEYSTREICSILIVDMFANSFTILINIVILLYLVPEVGILLLLWMGLHFTLLRLSFRNILVLNKNLVSSKSLMINNILETFLNILMIKTTNTVTYEQNKLNDLVNDYLKNHRSFLLQSETINALILIACEVLMWGGGTCLLIYKVSRNVMAISTITYIIINIYGIVSKVRSIGHKICKLFEHMGEYNIIYNILSEYSIPPTKHINLLETSSDTPLIEFKNVQLSHDNSPVLKHINLQIFEGEKVCIIGASGCGKSTLVNLLCGLYKNYKGEILVNNKDIRYASTDSIVQVFSITNQTSMLMTRSVHANLVQDRNISNEKIEACCKIAQIHDFIQSLPHQYNTNISIKTLSGGEAQRICLARMLLMDKPIKVFDEATNALDHKNRREFLRLLLNKCDDALKEDTMIFIDHSLEFLHHMNRVVLMNDGEILLNGPYEEIKKDPLFKKLKNHLND